MRSCDWPACTTVHVMNIDSLAWRSDLALLAAGGSKVDDRGDHLVVRTPGNPTFYWGNFLLLDEAPSTEQVPRWLELFENELPDCEHRAFGVNGTTGSNEDLSGFVAAGLTPDTGAVMTARAVTEPPHPHRDALLRPLRSDPDWEAQAALHRAGQESDATPEFAQQRARAQRSLVDQGHGQWFGAWLDELLVASLGIFSASEGVARFQQVKTHPDARGQGLCGTLVHHAAHHAFERMDAQTLVMVADPLYDAIRVYKSLGFEVTEHQMQAELSLRR